MTREELALLMLAQAEGRPFSPVQIQKALFLATVTLPKAMVKGRSYKFMPYSYGPFDRLVYEDMRALERQGLVAAEPAPHGRWIEYRATEQGLISAKRIAPTADPHIVEYLSRVASFVRGLSFANLVSAIYKAFPEMRQNSIFQD